MPSGSVDGRFGGAACATRGIGGIVVPRDGGAVVVRTDGRCSGSVSCDVPPGARERGSGAGCFGGPNRSSLGSMIGLAWFDCTRSIKLFTAVDSVLAIAGKTTKDHLAATQIWSGK